MPLAVLVVATLLCALEALPTVRGVLRLDNFQLTAADRILIGWSVWSVSIIALLPALLGGRLTTRFFGPRWGGGLFVVLSSLSATLLVVDLRAYELYGRHLAQFIEFLGMPQPWQFAGGGSAIVRQVAGVAIVITFTATVGYAVCYVVHAKLFARWAWLRRPWIRWCGILCGTMLIFLPLSIHRFARNRDMMERVWIAMPLDVRFDRANWRASQLSKPEFAALDRTLASAYRRHYPRLVVPKPIDASALVTADHPPNVVVIVLESLRHDVLEQGWMPRIRNWARNGLTLTSHYAGSNRSEVGIFGLLYGRSALAYDTTLRAAAPPQLCVSLRKSGYRSGYFSSHEQQWHGMEKFTNDTTFDRAEFNTAGGWIARDRTNIAKTRALVASSVDGPVLVMTCLICTHFEYRYPPEYEVHTPVNTSLKWRVDVTSPVGVEAREGLLNRYKNSLLFTDDLVADLVESLDPARNLVVITGDHGESFFDDGTLTHASKLAFDQPRTPMVTVAPGIPAGRIARPTQHADLLPTLLHALNGRLTPIQHCQGRDLLAAEPLPDHTLVSYQTAAVLITPGQRLQCQLNLTAPIAELDSFVDVDANPIATPAISPADKRRLTEAIEYELWRISN